VVAAVMGCRGGLFIALACDVTRGGNSHVAVLHTPLLVEVALNRPRQELGVGFERVALAGETFELNTRPERDRPAAVPVEPRRERRKTGDASNGQRPQEGAKGPPSPHPEGRGCADDSSRVTFLPLNSRLTHAKTDSIAKRIHAGFNGFDRIRSQFR
jgi:hypothetical protein